MPELIWREGVLLGELGNQGSDVALWLQKNEGEEGIEWPASVTGGSSEMPC